MQRRGTRKCGYGDERRGGGKCSSKQQQAALEATARAESEKQLKFDADPMAYEWGGCMSVSVIRYAINLGGVCGSCTAMLWRQCRLGVRA